MWQKFFWKLDDKIVGLYSYKNAVEEYYFEIIFYKNMIEKIIIMGSGNWNDKWQIYFRQLEMMSIMKTIELDNLLWSYYK